MSQTKPLPKPQTPSGELKWRVFHVVMPDPPELSAAKKLAVQYFLRFKIIGAPKKFKNQPRPLVRPSCVNFCQIIL
jgi:hypothetical protein